MTVGGAGSSMLNLTRWIAPACKFPPKPKARRTGRILEIFRGRKAVDLAERKRAAQAEARPPRPRSDRGILHRKQPKRAQCGYCRGVDALGGTTMIGA